MGPSLRVRESRMNSTWVPHEATAHERAQNLGPLVYVNPSCTWVPCEATAHEMAQNLGPLVYVIDLKVPGS